MRLPAVVLLAVVFGSATTFAQQTPDAATAPKAGAGGTSAPPADPFKNAGRPESNAGDVQQPGNTASAQALRPELRSALQSVSRVTVTAQQYGNLASMRHTTGAVHNLGDRMVITNSRINKALAEVAPELRNAEQMTAEERSQFDAVARYSNENEFARAIAQWIAERYPRVIAELERLGHASEVSDVVTKSLPEMKAQLADAQRILETASGSQAGRPGAIGSVGTPSAAQKSD